MLGAEKHLSSAEMLPNTEGVCVCKGRVNTLVCVCKGRVNTYSMRL